MDQDIRMGFVGIVVEKKDEIAEVNRVLTSFSDIIRGRIGIPNQDDHSAVIGLIVEGTNSLLGALTGKSKKQQRRKRPGGGSNARNR